MTILPSARPVRVSDPSSVGEARRHATAVAESAGLDGERIGNVSIIATELAVNLHLHGGGGELLVSPMAIPQPGVQLLAIDRGRGMGDVERCLVDGYSTAGTAGQGLGAIRRLSSRFDVHSQPRSDQIGGTVVLSQVLAANKPLAVPSLEIGAVCVPLDGETVCGDGWAADEGNGRSTILVTDGLGHGPLAAEATRAAITAFHGRGSASISDFLIRAHAALRPTRGAAASIAEIDLSRGVVRFAGVGNVAGRLFAGDRMRGMLSNNGTLGLNVSRTAEQQYPWMDGGLLILATDGLLSGWTLDGYVGLQRRHPAVIAAALYRDWARGRDDTTVVVIRRAAGPPQP